VAGCGTPKVAVSDVPAPQGADLAACNRLHDALPATVGDSLKRRDVTPTSPLVAAWGKPAAVLRCGVGIPATYRPGVELTVIDGIGWYEDDRADDVVYTAMTQEPRVALALPKTKTQSSSFEILVDLAGPVGQNTRTSGVDAQ
jgi:hypothetical protein